ncbi:helix-turn-helix transcriptional regulator [Paraburkholderia sediminicola]|uniref:helix-turn-helix transcriptional regulator n=1 Tax=Paraburkholderia sediminicola TaxID=458836 RepID=UPI0038BD7F95
MKIDTAVHTLPPQSGPKTEHKRGGECIKTAWGCKMTNTTLVHDVKPTLRPREVAAYCSIGVSTVWWLTVNDPTFPKKIKIGPKTTIFRKAEIDAWLAAKAGGAR